MTIADSERPVRRTFPNRWLKRKYKSIRKSFRRAPRPVEPLDVDSVTETMWPHIPQSTAELRAWSEARLEKAVTGDAFLDNLLRNKWEFANGRSVLKSMPWRLSVPFVTCNAQCEFCAAWLMHGKSDLSAIIRDLRPVIRHCGEIDLVGWGEPLVHPQFGEILDFLAHEADARARLALTTNGTRLSAWADRLVEANIMEYAVSLHAARDETHRDLMGFAAGEFEKVKAGVRLLAARKARHPGLTIEMVLVVTRQNLEEIPAFIAMSRELGADKVHLRTLMPMAEPRENLDYHRLPPYLHPRFEDLRSKAAEAIAASPIPVRSDPQTWDRPIFSPHWEARIADLPLKPRNRRKSYNMQEHDWTALGEGEPLTGVEESVSREDLYGRTAPYACASSYTAFYINGTDRRVIPCVYMFKVPNHAFMHFKPDMSFDQVWNSPAMVAVRHSLRHGPLMPECLKCPANC